MRKIQCLVRCKHLSWDGFINRKYTFINVEMYVTKQIIRSAEYQIRSFNIFILQSTRVYGALKVPMFQFRYHFLGTSCTDKPCAVRIMSQLLCFHY